MIIKRLFKPLMLFSCQYRLGIDAWCTCSILVISQESRIQAESVTFAIHQFPWESYKFFSYPSLPSYGLNNRVDSALLIVLRLSLREGQHWIKTQRNHLTIISQEVMQFTDILE